MQIKRNLKLQGLDSKAYGKRHEVCYRQDSETRVISCFLYISISVTLLFNSCYSSILKYQIHIYSHIN